MCDENNRWQIKTDALTGYHQAALQIIRDDTVSAWLMMSPAQLEELARGARKIARAIRERAGADVQTTTLNPPQVNDER